MKVESHLEIRSPIDQLESSLVRQDLKRPGAVPSDVVQALRYVLSFARMTTVRNEAGEDLELAENLAPHRWRVQEALRPYLEEKGEGIEGAVKVLPDLVKGTRKE